MLKAQINLFNNKTSFKTRQIKYFGFAYIFAKSKIVYHKRLYDSKNLTDLPAEGNIINKNNPIFTINACSTSPFLVEKLLRKEISMTRECYNCYDIET